MDPIEYQGNIEQFLCEKATINYTPINGILELTPLCNMNCDMCFIRLSPKEMAQKGRLRTAKEWISLGKEMCDAGTLFVLLTGGEPLLHPDFQEIYLALKKMGMILTINTNGTLIDEKWADFFAKYKPRRINITLYGKDEHTYQELCHFSEGFQKTINAINLLQERHVDVKVNGSITPENVDELDDLFAIVDQMGVAWKFDTYMYPASREKMSKFNYSSRLTADEAAAARVKLIQKREGQEKFFVFAKKFLEQGKVPRGELTAPLVKCRAGKSSFVINWQGMMRPCVILTSPEENVFDLGFAEAWKRIVDKFGSIRLSPECNACTMKEVCQTCAACAKAETGDFGGIPEYMCQCTERTLCLMQERVSEEQEIENNG